MIFAHRYLLTLLLFSMLLTGCKKDNGNNKLYINTNSQDSLSIAKDIKDDTTYISLLVQFFDDIKKERRNEILIIGKYINDKYLPFEESIDDSGKLYTSLTAKIIDRKKSFTSFSKGVKLAEYNIEGISLSEFSCLALPTGKAKMVKKFSAVSPAAAQKYNGYSGGREIDYSFNYHLAINNSANTIDKQRVQILDSTITEQEQAAIENCIRKEFEKDKNITEPLYRKDYNISAFNPGANEEKFYLITYHHDTDSLCFSSCIIVSFSNNIIEEKLNITNINEIDAWGSGYKLFDLFDFDGDGMNEVIFEIGYYESTGFEIYKLVDGKYQKVMEIIPWGC